jgi:acetate kinase
MKILVLNSGSSSQKSCVYELGSALPETPPAPLWQAEIDWTGRSGATELRVKNSRGANARETRQVDSRAAAIRHMLDCLWDGPAKVISKPAEIDVVGHRVVHGGLQFREPVLVTPEVISAIVRLSELAPLHNRAEGEGMQIIRQILRDVPQVAVFDTAFHSQLPPEAAVYPGPYEWLDEGIRRYGFHGINHQYCAGRAAQLLGKDPTSLRLISCHLGNGCSLAAIRGGRSVDTTMGFTPLDGLMMGSRSGSLDPGILTHLIRKHGYSAAVLDEILNKKSGLLGISGLSNDMRAILSAMARGNQRARLAFDIFVHRLRSCIGSMLAALGGLDALVFTAGIGENSADVRAAACESFAFLGLKLDPDKNLQSPPDQDIAVPASVVRVLIIRAQEDWAIARECWRLIRVPAQARQA